MKGFHRGMALLAWSLLSGCVLLGNEYVHEDFSVTPAAWKGQRGGKAERVLVEGNPALKVTLPGLVVYTSKRPSVIKAGDSSVTGISLRLKGDGGDYWVPVVLKNRGGWNWRYTALAHVTGKDWQTVTLHWRDFIPAEGTMDAEIGQEGTMPVWTFDKIEFGDRWKITHCNRRIKPYTFWVDDIKFIDTPAPKQGPVPSAAKLGDVVRKMRGGEPVLIFCSGDSITAGTCVQNADVNRYGSLLQVMLRKAFNNDKITVTTVAVGGAHTFDLRVWAKKDLALGTPDLMTLLVGFNDKSGALSAMAYGQGVEDYLDRVQRLSKGRTAFLLFPTIPGSAYRYDSHDDYARVIRHIAAKRGLDTFALDRILKGLDQKTFNSIFTDIAHPNNAGHKMIAEKLTEYLVNYGK